MMERNKMHVLTKYQAVSGYWRLLVNGNVHPLLVGFDTPEEALDKGSLLFPDGVLVETPETFLNWTLPSQEINTPFDLQPIVQESISLEYLIDLLKSRFNISYMRLSNGNVKSNRKPKYVNQNEIRNLIYGTSTYMLSNEALKTYSFSLGEIPIEPHIVYAGMLLIDGVEVLVNLYNPYAHTFVRLYSREAKKNAWLNWTHELLNIDKNALRITIEENF
jgi:hypothetical protein